MHERGNVDRVADGLHGARRRPGAGGHQWEAATGVAPYSAGCRDGAGLPSDICSSRFSHGRRHVVRNVEDFRRGCVALCSPDQRSTDRAVSRHSLGIAERSGCENVGQTGAGTIRQDPVNDQLRHHRFGPAAAPVFFLCYTSPCTVNDNKVYILSNLK